MDFLGHEGVVLQSNDEAIRGRESILDWIAEANRRFARVEFQVGPIEVTPVERDVFEARFKVDRRAWDSGNLLHLSRTHHSWQILVSRDSRFQLLHAEESSALPHPGTGTQILCL